MPKFSNVPGGQLQAQASPGKSVDAEIHHCSSPASSSNRGSNSERTDRSYYVEKIIDKRINRGKNEYFVKWLNYDSDDNSWEPEDNMNCDQMIAEFENKFVTVTKESAKTPQSNAVKDTNIENNCAEKTVPKNNAVDNNPIISPQNNNSIVRPQDNNLLFRDVNDLVSNSLEAERIIGAVNSPEGILFLVKWRNKERADLVPNNFANVQFPQVVIDFYQRNFQLVDPTGLPKCP